MPIACCLLLALTGCGAPESTVSGTVTLDGKPLSLGTVTFHPQAEGTPGYGEIDADGQYNVQTNSGGGLVPGDYMITVVALEPSVVPTDPKAMPSPGKRLTPEGYASVKTTDLRRAVDAGPNQIDLPLTSN